MYLCIINQEGDIVLQRNIRTNPAVFLKTIERYREDIAVAFECIFTWYWIADLCAKEGIPFVLGQANYLFSFPMCPVSRADPFFTDLSSIRLRIRSILRR